MGEDKAFEFMKAMHKNVNQYTKSGAAPARAAATGESLVGITFQHDAVVQAVGGAPVNIVSPCEGTGYEIGSMSIVKGAKNMENAKKWYDWALSTEAQAIGSGAKVSYQVPSNKSAPVPAQAPKLSEVKLINYDFVKYGSSAERKRLLEKWDKEVSTLPK
jgi:iron(III) transport system substrate-binding protein